VEARQQVLEAVRRFGWDPARGPLDVEIEKLTGLAESLRPLFGDDPVCVMVAGEHGEIVNEFPGVHGVEDAWRDWLATFDDYKIEASDLEITDAGIIGLGRQWGRSALAGIEIEHEAGIVILMPEDRIERVEFHLHHATALRAARSR
jgi:hypothetical protein